MISFLHGMRFAAVEVTATSLRVVTMHHNKDTQKVVIAIEATLWALLVLFFGLSYLLV